MRLSIFLGLLVLSPLSLAQPAVYQDLTLTIPQGAVVTDGQVAYYENIQMGITADGDFQALSVEERSLVHIEDVAVNVMESLPVQVSLTVTGNKSVPCVNLLTPAVAYDDGVFTVVLAESELGPEESCIALVTPFETEVDLDVEGLVAGDYTVRVNDIETTFTLTADN